jgi:ATP-dependent RNA helicase DeaD
MTTEHDTPLDETLDLPPGFSTLPLPATLLKALSDVGYELPTPIQSRVIPVMVEGKDLLGQAQTGTGKTAAFALPILANIDLKRTAPQALVLTPTRELAIQVAAAFEKYAAHIPGFQVVAIYGGQEYTPQFRRLNRGVHVIVGTPGRVMDHISRSSINLDYLKTLVLDEADEMLRMGFKEDVEWVLEHTPETRQIALFSATLPAEIRAIARKYLKEPEEISIKAKTTTVEATRQRYWLVQGIHRLDALTRILEAETYDAVLIFVRTKLASLDLVEKLVARGFAAAPLNGDIAQSQRERTVEQLKSGKLNLLVATDVAARGLDVDRISHVINYDVPYDTEAYIHRIGRTGRAGRSGEAILFVAPRERRLLQIIEKSTRQKIERMDLPSVDTINTKRLNAFKQKITDTLTAQTWKPFREVVEQCAAENEADPLDVAAALATLFQGSVPFLLEADPVAERAPRYEDRPARHERSDRFGSDRSERYGRADRGDRPERSERTSAGGPRHRIEDFAERESGMVRYRIEVGRRDGVKPNNIVGAVAGETGIAGKEIGRIKIFDSYCLIDLPEGLTDRAIQKLQKARIVGKFMGISVWNGEGAPDEPRDVPRTGERRPRPESHRSRFEEKPDWVVKKRGESAAPAEASELSEPSEKPARAESHEADHSGHSDRPERADRPLRFDRPEKTDRPRWTDRPERADRPRRSESSDRPERPRRSEGSDRPEHTDRPERPRRSEGSARPEHTDRPERPRRAESSDRPERPRRSDSPDRPEHSDRPARAEHAEPSPRSEGRDEKKRGSDRPPRFEDGERKRPAAGRDADRPVDRAGRTAEPSSRPRRDEPRSGKPTRSDENPRRSRDRTSRDTDRPAKRFEKPTRSGDQPPKKRSGKNTAFARYS